MNKTKLGKVLNKLAIALFILAGIVYAITRIGRVPFWCIEAGMVAAFLSIILLHKDKASVKKPLKILNWLFITVPILVFIGVVIYVLLLGYAFGHSDWQF